jgi:hypothetical protein
MVTSQNSPVPGARTVTPVASAQAAPSATQPAATAPQPSEEEIRDYANHLHVQSGSLNGHDRDDWLEAEACLRANIPKESSRTRMHHHTQVTERAVLPLVKHGRS